MFQKFIPLICLILAACGSSKTMVLEAPQQTAEISSFKLVEGKSTTAVPQEAKELFYKSIENGLLEHKYSKGDDLIIEYRYIQFDEGSQFSRWMWGGLGNSGEGELTVEVKFKNKNAEELATIHVGGKIGSGAFGGSFNYAIENAAEEVVRYIARSFPNSRKKQS